MDTEEPGPEEVGPEELGPDELGPEEMGPEELGPRDVYPIRPAQVGPLVWVAIALAALGAGFFVLGQDGTRPSADRRPDPAPSAGPSGGPSAGPPAPAWLPPRPGPNQRQFLGVTAICSPVTDGSKRLAASFEVTNVSEDRVSVDSVTGVLPEGGLRQRGPVTLGGSCSRPGTLPPVEALPAGESRYYTLTFDLPKSCPARYPVLVRVEFAAAGFAETSLSLLYSDLSVPDFKTCRPGRKARQPS
jgi:hypothetical protein